MLKPARMYRVDCIVYERFREQLVDRLHSDGIVQVECLGDEFLKGNSLVKFRFGDDFKRVSELISKSRELVSTLSPYGVEDAGFIEGALDIDCTPKTFVTRMSFADLVDSSGRFVESSLSEAKLHEEGISILASKVKAVEEDIVKYGLLTRLKHPIEHFGLSSMLYSVVGHLPKDMLGGLTDSLAREFGGLYFASRFDERDGQCFMVAVVPASYSQELNKVLSGNQFRIIDVSGSGTVAERLERLSAELNSVKERLSQERCAMQDLYKRCYLKALVTKEVLELQKQKCEVNINFALTGKTVLLRMWVPEGRYDALEEVIREESGDLYILDVDREPVDAPVLLENPRLFRPFEMFTRMFSMPNYNQIDPTVLIAPTFVLFFGMMFADVVYGVLLFALAYWLGRSYGQYSKSIRDFSRILTYFSFSTILFGFLTGSFFGDFLGTYVIGSEKGSQAVALWLDPLYNGNMMTYLVLVFSVGFAHVLLGYFSGGFDAVRRKQYKTALMDYASMILMPVSAVAYFLTGSTAFLAVCAVSLLAIFISSGVMGFYLKVSGVIGNVVSYARLLALMAAAGGISMTVNFMSSLMLSIPYAGVVIAPVVFIGGHTINLALNILGSFVHTLRLHYVEFFGTFYEGGGVEFSPFAESRKYSKLIQKEVT
ncbi:MAG: V-type ATP synthase subunit I [Candidatus Altiarchaeota archaeon]|nr:V-type ATP synthase subunit I [Candidatus Altiarchaeota archaeon]